MLRLYVGYQSNRDSAIVQVLDTTYHGGIVTYHLGKGAGGGKRKIIRKLKKKEKSTEIFGVLTEKSYLCNR